MRGKSGVRGDYTIVFRCEGGHEQRMSCEDTPRDSVEALARAILGGPSEAANPTFACGKCGAPVTFDVFETTDAPTKPETPSAKRRAKE